jgi:glycerophosphoryl diester phosphodiesterase
MPSLPSRPDPERTRWLGGAIYAHRGWHGDGRVENSPSAFGAAIAAHLGIECDVQVSADGAAMVFHDWELDRMTAETGPVRQRSAAELAALRLAGSADPIWRLEQLLANVAGRVPLLIELKSRRDTPYVPLCRAVMSALAGYAGPVAAMSFDPRVVRWFSREAPAVVRGLVVSESLASELQRHYALMRGHPDFLAYDVRNLPSRFAAAQRRRGLPVLTWTVASGELLDRARLHADAPIAEGAGLAAALAGP